MFSGSFLQRRQQTGIPTQWQGLASKCALHMPGESVLLGAASHTERASTSEGATRCTEGPAFKVFGCCSHNPILFPTTLSSARCTAGISSAAPSSCSRNRDCFSPGNVLQEERVQQHQAQCQPASAALLWSRRAGTVLQQC